MNDEETVVVDISILSRVKLDGELTRRMEQLGFADYDSLDLGFEILPGWPADISSKLTLAQLVVLARKLKMRIVISDIDLVPIRDKGEH